jgi:AcrR family transcriptional regulator
MLTVSTLWLTITAVLAAAPRRKARRAYHHGDLRRALLAEAVRTIGAGGIATLTLREVGRRLGVSRTALYRHFTDKRALLAAVAREGFQQFRQDLVEAWEAAGRGSAGFNAMGMAYVRFAIANPSHYRVMFGGFRDLCDKDPELAADAAAAFQVLVDALATLRPTAAAVEIDRLAHYIWATVHGIAMLGIDGQLGPDPAAALELMQFATERLRIGGEQASRGN